MYKRICSIIIFLLFFQFSNAQALYEYDIITVVESIIPNGLGRSRIIYSIQDVNLEGLSDEEKKSVKRKDIRVNSLEETKLLNFFNLGGIRFENIASNDAIVRSKLNAMGEAGWELSFVTSGVESFSGKEDVNGIFVTRYVFKRKLD